MSRKLIAAILLAGLLCLIQFLRLSFRLVQAALLSFGTPQCPTCGRHDMRLSRPSGVLDGLLRLLRCHPYRCRVCGGRFYRFSDGVPVPELRPAPTKQAGPGAEPCEILPPPNGHRGIRIRLHTTEAQRAFWAGLIKVTLLAAVAGLIAVMVLAATSQRSLRLPR